MDRKEILGSPEYWTSKTQLELYGCAMKFMKDTRRDRTRLAEYLGVSKGYVTQLLNGDYDHRLSKFFELALAFGYVPKIEFVPVAELLEEIVPVTEAKEEKWNEASERNEIKLSYTNNMYPHSCEEILKIAE